MRSVSLPLVQLLAVRLYVSIGFTACFVSALNCFTSIPDVLVYLHLDRSDFPDLIKALLSCLPVWWMLVISAVPIFWFTYKRINSPGHWSSLLVISTLAYILAAGFAVLHAIVLGFFTLVVEPAAVSGVTIAVNIAYFLVFFALSLTRSPATRA